MRWPTCRRLPDEEQVAEFLANLPEASTRSFFQGIERVLPGHVVTVTGSRWSACAAPLALAHGQKLVLRSAADHTSEGLRLPPRSGGAEAGVARRRRSRRRQSPEFRLRQHSGDDDRRAPAELSGGGSGRLHRRAARRIRSAAAAWVAYSVRRKPAGRRVRRHARQYRARGGQKRPPIAAQICWIATSSSTSGRC